MFHTPLPGTHFYRVTRQDAPWPEVLSGAGAYYTVGSRYSRPQQRTVYAAEDALVAITEQAYYAALDWQSMIGGGPPPQPPLPNRTAPAVPPFTTEHQLWSFTLNPVPRLLDLEHPNALQVFQHARYSLLNPCRDYRTTQDVADAVRVYPSPTRPDAGGLKAPAVRTPSAPGYQPYQDVFFVRDRLPGRQRKRWRLTIEFLDDQGAPVGPHSRNVNWREARGLLSGSRTPIPPFPLRPGAEPLVPGTWFRIPIQYA